MKLKKSLLSLVFLSSVASANISSQLAQVGPVDIAIDLKNGVTYVQAKKENAGGQIFVLDSNTGMVLDNDLYAYSMVVKNQDTEIELFNDGELLSRVNDELMILTPVKLGERLIWETTYLNNEELEDFSNIKNIKFESNGLLSFEAYSKEASEDVIAFFSFVKKGKDTTLQKEKVLLASAAEEALEQEVVDEELPKDEEEEIERSNSLGFTAGMIAGLGISYRKHFENGMGVHVGAVAFGNEDSVNANLGVQILRTVRKNEKSRLYLLAGSAVFWDRHKEYDYGTPEYPEVKYDPETDTKEVYYSENYQEPGMVTVNDYMLNFGLGFGMELAAKQGIGVALEMPITVTFSTQDDSSLSFKQVYPIPALTIFYRF